MARRNVPHVSAKFQNGTPIREQCDFEGRMIVDHGYSSMAGNFGIEYGGPEAPGRLGDRWRGQMLRVRH